MYITYGVDAPHDIGTGTVCRQLGRGSDVLLPPCDVTSGIIPLSAADVSDQYEVFITPIGWAFAIWGIIYTWLGVALVYGKARDVNKNV